MIPNDLQSNEKYENIHCLNIKRFDQLVCSIKLSTKRMQKLETKVFDR